MKFFDWNRHRIRGLFVFFAMLLLAATGAVQADTVSDNGADWLIGQQVAVGPDTAAFPWHAGDADLPGNLQGAVALGLVRTYERTGYVAALDAALLTGNCLLDNCVSNTAYPNGDHRFGSHDPLFLIALSNASGDSRYAQLVATDLWDKFASASYGPTQDWDAAAYVAVVLGIRDGQGAPQIAAFDLFSMAAAAQLDGRTQMASDFMAGVLDSVEAADNAHHDSDILGLAAAIWASRITGIDLNPVQGTWGTASSTTDLAALLADYQAPNGGFIVSTSQAPAADVDVDLQTTAYALQALYAADAVQYQDAIEAGLDYLRNQQTIAGDFSTTDTEAHSEALAAYTGLALVPTQVYVDDDYAGALPGTTHSFVHPQVNGGSPINVIYGQDAFASIGEALDAVADGGTVYVAEGTYAEGYPAIEYNLVIERPVHLIGAQAGVDARNRPDSGASVIIPQYPTTGLSYGTAGNTPVVYIGSDNVTLDGFVIDGDNPDLSSGVVMGTADPDVDSGIFAVGSQIEIRNNVIRNLVYAGIYAYNGATSDPVRTGNVIRHNWIHNLDAPSEWGIGIGVLWNYYADIDANLLEDVRVGIQTNYFFKTIPNPEVDARIRNNEVHASGSAIYHNYQDGTPSAWTLEDNQLFAVDNPAQDGLWVGFAFQGLLAGTVHINNNVIDGSALATSGRATAGYRINLISSDEAADTTIQGGSVSHVDYGVLATDGAFYDGRLDDMNITGIAFDDVSIAAFYVEDTAPVGSETVDNVPKITVGTGHSYNNVAQQAALAGPNATIALATGMPGFDTVLVRAANDGHRPGEPDSHGNVRHVDNALVNGGIAIAADGGTVEVEAGTYDQNVVIDKSVTVQGPFAGIAGFDASRDGSGEAIISPANGRGVMIVGDYHTNVPVTDVVFDGFTIQDIDANGMAAIWGGINHGGGNSDTVSVINNRVLDVHAGNGLYTSGPVGTVKNWTVAHNLFRNIDSAVGSGINLWAAIGGSVVDNRVENAGWAGIQIVNSQDVLVQDNAVIGTGAAGISVGQTPTGVGSSNIRVLVNTIDGANASAAADQGGLNLSGQNNDVVMACNTVSGNNGFSTAGSGVIDYSSTRIFDNALTDSTDISHESGGAIAIGSNWYGGGNPVIGGSHASDVSVADALSADPVGEAACGDNAPAQIVAVSGDGQSTIINTAFTDPLEVRVLDALGGAVMGEAVSFTAPASGASASLGTASGSTDYNGAISTTATANGTAGSYEVNASSGTLADAVFALTNEQAEATITLDAATLSATYDGSAHVVTATTDPSGLGYSVTYDGNSVAPTDAGSYAVVATITDPDYTGTTSGTLVIAKAVGTVDWGQLTFTYDGSSPAVAAGIAEEAGTSCTVTPATIGPDAGSYPVSASCDGVNYTASDTATATIDPATVTLALSDLTQTWDGSPKPATVTTTPAGVAHVVTYDGNAAAPSDIGEYAVVATVNDPNYSGDQVSGVLHIVAADAPDLAVSITDNRDFARYGQLLSYVIVVSNVGNTAVAGAEVEDVLPDSLLALEPVSWHCFSNAAGTCGAASGSGDLSVDVDLEVNGSVTIVLDAVVNDDPGLVSDLIINTVTVAAAGDVDGSNDVASDETQAVIFRDGFELHGDGAQVPTGHLVGDAVLGLDGQDVGMLDLAGAWASDSGLMDIARLRGNSGELVRVQGIRVGTQLRVRLLGQVDGKVRLSDWTEVGPNVRQLAVGLIHSDGQRALLLVGAADDLEIELADGSPTLSLWAPSAGDQ